MAPHQGHQNGASALVSRALLVPQQPHPSAASLHAAVSPTLAALAPGTHPPHAHKEPHLHKHQTSNKQMLSVSIHQPYALVHQRNHNI